MKALTLKRPWPYTILHLGKRIENRSDKRGMPPMCKYRGPLLLHAAKSWDESAKRWMRARNLARDALAAWVSGPRSTEPRFPIFHAGSDAHPTGIVGRCRVVGQVQPCHYCDGTGRELGRPGGAECSSPPCVRGAWLEHEDRGADLRWWMGGHGLILDDVEALDEPIPCNGRLGLWTPPDDVLAQLPVGWRDAASQS
jgi:hypothetical protein